MCIEAPVEPARGIGGDPKQALAPAVPAATVARARQLRALRHSIKTA
jgi:3-deoxy-7-phosphoheptulonate synthase